MNRRIKVGRWEESWNSSSSPRACGFQRMSTFYESFVMRPQDFSSIFRKARKDLREDLKKGTAASGGSDLKPSESTSDTSALTPQSASKFAHLPYEKWESLKGTTMEAKVEAVNGDKITLKAKDGRTAKLKQCQLSGDSLRRLKQISG